MGCARGSRPQGEEVKPDPGDLGYEEKKAKRESRRQKSRRQKSRRQKSQRQESRRQERRSRKILARQYLATKEEAAVRIQAWWRGTLVRRTLLGAALRAWVIQGWWRALLWRHTQKLQQVLLKVYVIQEQAAVLLQACVRMCRCHQRYRQVRSTLWPLQAPRGALPLQVRDRPQEQPADAVKGLEFHVEILSI